MKAWVFWAATFLSGVLAWGQDDPFAVVEPENQIELGRAIDLVFEVFSLSPTGAAEVLQNGTDDKDLYRWMLRELAAGRAKQEVFQSVAARSGEEVVVRDGGSFSYPSESRAAVGVAYPPSLLAWEEAFAPPVPSALIRQNLGWTLRLEPVLDPATGIIASEVSGSRVKLSRKLRWGKSPVDKVVPCFSRGEFRTEISAASGEVSFLGTIRDGGPVGGEGPVGLAFLRATLAGEKTGPPSVETTRLIYEVFSLPLGKAARLRRAEGEVGLYRSVRAALAEKTVVQEEVIAWSGSLGGGSIGQIEEISYPTEYDPSGVGQPPGGQPAWHVRQGRRDFVHDYRSFETRNVGVSLDFSGRWDDKGSLALSLEASHLGVPGRRAWGQKQARWEFPEFDLCRLKCSTILSSGRPVLIGTINRTGEPGKVRWAFVTIRRGK